MDYLLHACTALHAAALMAWFGALSVRRVLGAGQGAGEMRFLQIAGVLALLSGAIWPLLETGVLRDAPSAATDPAQVVELLTQTHFGRTWLMREAAIVLATGLSFAPLRAIGRSVYFLVTAALASLALLGHAAGVDGADGNLQRLALALHLLVAGAWVGALPVLWVLCGRLQAVDLERVMRHFSRYGLALVAVVLLSGGFSAWSRISAAAELIGTPYGQLLLLKVGLVGFMGIAALLNRNTYAPKLASTDPWVQGQARMGLRRSIGIELVLGIAVVSVAVFLGAAEAPR